MRQKRKGNFRVLDNFNHFVPGFPELLIILVFFLLGIVIGNAVNLMFVKILGAEVGTKYGMLVSYPLMFLPPMIYASVKSGLMANFETGFKTDNNNFKPVGGVVCALVAVLATLCANYVSDFFVTILPPMPQWLEDALAKLVDDDILLNFISVAIFAPFFEEWLCRGTVLRGLLYYGRKNGGRGLHPAVAIIISAVFFALIHANPWQAIPAFLLGCVFGYVYWKTGSLKLTMLMHCFNNSMALFLGQIPALKEMDSWKDVLPSEWYWLIYACCALLLVLSIKVFAMIPCTNAKGSCEELTASSGN